MSMAKLTGALMVSLLSTTPVGGDLTEPDLPKLAFFDRSGVGQHSPKTNSHCNVSGQVPKGGLRFTRDFQSWVNLDRTLRTSPTLVARRRSTDLHDDQL
jgi:hypothetical protein